MKRQLEESSKATLDRTDNMTNHKVIYNNYINLMVPIAIFTVNKWFS